jgi:beta-N-acetylhexosaminidase
MRWQALDGWRRLPVRRRIWAVAAAVTAVSVVALLVQWARPDRPARPHGAVTGAPTAASPATPSLTAANPGQRLDACVTAAVSKLDLDGRVGQLLMVGTPIANPPALAETVRRQRLGGVFLAGRSTQSAATVRQGIRALQQAAPPGVPLHIAVDQEGGQVQTLRSADFPTIPSAVEQGRWDAATLRARTADWAQRLADAGITLDLAPVADTVPPQFADANPPIGAFNRQYGSTPDEVAGDVETVVAAVQGAGVLTTLKHFPGLGRVRSNTDTSSNTVDNATTADDAFLKPFVSGIRAGSAAVMISSARYPRLDSQAIAAFSAPIVTGLLRERLGYTGLVVSDDLGAAAAAAAVPVGERAVRFVQAGGDLVLTVRPGDAGPMHDALVAAAQASLVFDARVTDAARHVLRSKYRAKLLTC